MSTAVLSPAPSRSRARARAVQPVAAVDTSVVLQQVVGDAVQAHHDRQSELQQLAADVYRAARAESAARASKEQLTKLLVKKLAEAHLSEVQADVDGQAIIAHHVPTTRNVIDKQALAKIATPADILAMGTFTQGVVIEHFGKLKLAEVLRTESGVSFKVEKL